MSSQDVIDAVSGEGDRSEEPLRVVWRGNDIFDFFTRRLTLRVKVTSRRIASCGCVEYAKRLSGNCFHGEFALRICKKWHIGKRAKWPIPFTVPISELDPNGCISAAFFPGAPLRPIRAVLIAEHGGIVARGGGVFSVPSQSTAGAHYVVEFHENLEVSCSCLDWKSRRRRRRCKHGDAVVLTLEALGITWQDAGAGEVLPAINTTSEQLASFEQLTDYQGARRNPVVHPKFPIGEAKFRTRQKRAARTMPERLPRMLFELLEQERLESATPWHRPKLLALHQRAFCVLMRVFENRPYADVCHSLVNWQQRGLLPASPGVNTLCAYFRDSELDALLKRLVRRIARVVRNLEYAAVLDSSSFSTLLSANYRDSDRGKRIYRVNNRWLKAHVIAGPTTNVVSSIIITWNKRGPQDDKSNPTADVKFFMQLLRDTIELGWNLKFVAADKGYFDEDHYTIPMRELGIKVFIPFKRNTNATGKSAEMIEMLELYDKDPDGFDAPYNSVRPKIEGIFSATKRSTGASLWSRGEMIPEGASDEEFLTVGIARKNELMAKFIIHSLRQLVMLECLHDEEVNFYVDRAFTPLPEEGKILEDAREEMMADGLGDVSDQDELHQGEDEIA
jgi:hypothetical protein